MSGDFLAFKALNSKQYKADVRLQLAAVPDDPQAEPQPADDVDEVFWAPVSVLRELPGGSSLPFPRHKVLGTAQNPPYFSTYDVSDRSFRADLGDHCARIAEEAIQRFDL